MIEYKLITEADIQGDKKRFLLDNFAKLVARCYVKNWEKYVTDEDLYGFIKDVMFCNYFQCAYSGDELIAFGAVEVIDKEHETELLDSIHEYVPVKRLMKYGEIAVREDFRGQDISKEIRKKLFVFEILAEQFLSVTRFVEK